MRSLRSRIRGEPSNERLNTMTNTTKNAARLTILRSLPGGGKSHYAAPLEAAGAVVASADRFPGLYSVDAEGVTQIDMGKLDPAHGASVRTAIEGLQAGAHVVVDATNLSADELIPDVALAQAFRVACEIVTIETDPAVAFGRQTHGVPHGVFFGTPAVEASEGVDATPARPGMVDRFAAFVAPFHWQFMPWLTLTTVKGS